MTQHHHHLCLYFHHTFVLVPLFWTVFHPTCITICYNLPLLLWNAKKLALISSKHSWGYCLPFHYCEVWMQIFVEKRQPHQNKTVPSRSWWSEVLRHSSALSLNYLASELLGCLLASVASKTAGRGLGGESRNRGLLILKKVLCLSYLPRDRCEFLLDICFVAYSRKYSFWKECTASLESQ